jgi:hypothetical protein
MYSRVDSLRRHEKTVHGDDQTDTQNVGGINNRRKRSRSYDNEEDGDGDSIATDTASNDSEDEDDCLSDQSLKLLQHYLQQAEIKKQSGTLGSLRKLVLEADPEDDESESEDDSDEESDEMDEDNEHDDTPMSEQTLEFLLAVVKAARRNVYPISKTALVSMLDSTYPLPKDDESSDDDEE